MSLISLRNLQAARGFVKAAFRDGLPLTLVKSRDRSSKLKSQKKVKLLANACRGADQPIGLGASIRPPRSLSHVPGVVSGSYTRCTGAQDPGRIGFCDLQPSHLLFALNLIWSETKIGRRQTRVDTTPPTSWGIFSGARRFSTSTVLLPVSWLFWTSISQPSSIAKMEAQGAQPPKYVSPAATWRTKLSLRILSATFVVVIAGLGGSLLANGLSSLYIVVLLIPAVRRTPPSPRIVDSAHG